uniref:CD209 antigen-like protein C n=1 Tax=Coturnix japonica TaxID=93934 RepID=A0A8C2SSD8_COTJA
MGNFGLQIHFPNGVFGWKKGEIGQKRGSWVGVEGPSTFCLCFLVTDDSLCWKMGLNLGLKKGISGRAVLAVLSFLPSPPQRPIALLALLLALSFVFLMALSIANSRRVSAMQEELERARLQDKQSHSTAWHNLSKVQQGLDTQLSAELRVIHSHLLNVSREVEEVQQKMEQCRAECGMEMKDRIQALEGREALQPALKQLEELKQEQNRISTLLSTTIEETRNLTEMFCTSCPVGWQQFAKTCYYFSTEGKTWVEARAACSMLGAQLAIVNSEMENKFLANHIMEIRAFWLGLNDMNREGEWEWLDGQPLSISYVPLPKTAGFSPVLLPHRTHSNTVM